MLQYSASNPPFCGSSSASLHAEESARDTGAQEGASRPGTYVQRELYFLGQEDLGTFRFEYLQNDGQRQHNIWWAPDTCPPIPAFSHTPIRRPFPPGKYWASIIGLRRIIEIITNAMYQ